MMMTQPRASNLASDDQLLFFPTVGRHDHETGLWLAPIHGWIFRTEQDSLRRAAAFALLHRLVRLTPDEPKGEMLNRRLRAFLVDNLADRVVTIQIDGANYPLAPSGANGHFKDVLRLPSEVVATTGVLSTDSPTFAERWITFTAALDPDDPRQVQGVVHLLPDEGLSVISDIDDTIKVSHVGRRRKLLKQTFVRDFEAVEGMAELYARWQAHGAAFHYVSRSPWQLYEPLAEFTAASGFPRGAFHLRNFRWSKGRMLRSDTDRDLKQRIIHEMFTAFPRRRFVLVGDSGERDPEVYGDVARAFPEQTQAVLIRNTTGESPRGQRFAKAFEGFSPVAWQVFDDPRELTDFSLQIKTS